MLKVYFLVPIALVAACLCPQLGAKPFGGLERMVGYLGRAPLRGIAIVGAVSLLICASLGLLLGVAPPKTHDEFGYLLIADTLAHGRLTNPTHPLWPHFESIHVIQNPTYASKYPPAQGFALCVGEVAFGVPIVGIWISTALAASAVCWMLLPWVPSRWAMCGGLMTALHPQMLVWSQSYWGGAIAVMGGALVLGAFRRIIRQPRSRDMAWLAVGMAVLANSRPYEGFVFCTLVFVGLGGWALFRGTGAWRTALWPAVLPLVAGLLMLSTEIGYYNYRVTGSAIRLPYEVCEDTYGIAPLFLFQSPKPQPQYRHAEIKRLQLDYLRYFQRQTQSVSSLIRSSAHKLYTVFQAAVWGQLLTLPLLAAFWVSWRDGYLRLLLLVGVGFSLAMLLGTWVFPHYAAPAGGLFCLLVVAGLRRIKTWHWPHQGSGNCYFRLTLLLCAGSSLLTVLKLAKQDEGKWARERLHVIEALERAPGQQLLFVHYQASHNPNREWVYNSADIDTAKVAVARIMSPEENRKLCEYFQDRRWWFVEADAEHPVATIIHDPSELPPPVSVDDLGGMYESGEPK